MNCGAFQSSRGVVSVSMWPAVAWADFLSCKQCLQDFGYVNDNEVTDVGKLIGR